MSGLSLANPLLALGAIGVAAPIIIHLLFRRKARTLEFSAMRFVLMSYKKVARRLMVKEYLLLAARCLLCLLLAFALARPLLAKLVEGFKRGERPLAVMLILDDSLSMTRAGEDGTLFAQAKEAAGDWLGRIVEGDRVGLIDAARLATVPPGDDVEKVRAALDKIEPTYAPARMLEALAAAAAELEAYPHAERMAIVLTDLQRAGWTAPVELPADAPALLIVDVSEGAPGKNVSVGNVKIARKSLAREDAAEVRATVQNHGPEGAPRMLLRVLLDDEVAAQGFVEAGPDEAVEKTLLLTEVPKGAGEVALEVDDGMTGDNQAYFHLRGGAEVKALVIDGDPKPNRFESETYFLDQALNPRLYARSKVVPRTAPVAELERLSLDAFDVLVLANVDKLPAPAAERIKAFVKNGGGLLIALGDKVNADVYNAVFGELLPRELRGAKLSYAGAKAGGDVRPMRLEAPTAEDLKHPILTLFNDASQGDLGLASFKKFFLLQQEATPKSQVILRLTDGSPIMVESVFGAGKVILFASSLDRDWNDLCIHPTFLPLFQQTVQYLSGALMFEDAGQNYVGRLIDLPADPDVIGGRVIGPGGQSAELELIEEVGAKRLRIGKAERPGVYLVKFKRRGTELASAFSAKEADRVLALNIDPAESDLTRIGLDEIKARTGVGSAAIFGAGAPVDPAAAQMVETKSFAPLLLWLLVGTAIFERALARK